MVDWYNRGEYYRGEGRIGTLTVKGQATIPPREMIVLDSNVVIDLVARDGACSRWSEKIVAEAEHRRVCSPIVLAEMAPHFVADVTIGAHASALGATLVTRDRQWFATYFADLSLITPETHP